MADFPMHDFFLIENAWHLLSGMHDITVSIDFNFIVKHTSLEEVSGEDQWCWEQRFIDVAVGTEDIKGIAFVHKGYRVNVISTHDVDAYMTQPDGSHVDLKLKKGSQQMCVASPGLHVLHLSIYLKGEKYLLKGQIHVDSSSLSGIEELPENILVDVLNNEGTLLDGTSARLVGNGNDQASGAVYEYSLWGNPGEKLTFTPQDSREKNGKPILFYPRQHVVTVTQDGCQASIPPFSGRPGIYIEGLVSPPLSGTDGIYVGGPLYDDMSYSIEASKVWNI
ncbi:carbohydrate-binding-like fold [Actinidia rufa]|uniref:Carbohydrate-binding-like fold n=1 Tax=Actinidia rufa TaxID=165716 RepID=A0A7J0GS63_9ERIC|nr:carbohydrate-binding-like fold [Actinidia rufa]